LRILVLGSKYGRRAARTIDARSEHEAEFLEVNEPPENVILDEESAERLLPAEIAGFDLVVCYLRHPDLQLALAERTDVPIYYALLPEPALRRQIRDRHDAVAFADPTPCSMLPETGVDAIDRLLERFGRPEVRVKVSSGVIESVEVVRGAPCGATWAAADRVEGMEAGREAVNTFVLTACHHCVAPRLGRYESKDVSSYYHGKALADALGIELDVSLEDLESPL